MARQPTPKIDLKGGDVMSSVLGKSKTATAQDQAQGSPKQGSSKLQQVTKRETLPSPVATASKPPQERLTISMEQDTAYKLDDLARDLRRLHHVRTSKSELAELGIRLILEAWERDGAGAKFVAELSGRDRRR